MNGNRNTATVGNLRSSVVRRFPSRSAMVSNLLLSAIGSIVAIGVLVCLAVLIRPDASTRAIPADVVRVYCAAGVAQPIEYLADSFNRQSDYQIEIARIGGSGELAGQIKLESESKLPGAAGVFVTNDEQLLTELSMQGIFESQIALATQRPVIAVPTGSGLKFSGLPAMTQTSDIRFGVASTRAAVGSLARKIAADHDVLEYLENNKTLDAENVMVLAQALATGSLDAAIVWDSTLRQINDSTDIESLKIAGPADPADQTTGNVTIGIIAAEVKPLLGAKAFAKYLQGSKSRRIFKSHGFEPIEQTSKQ